MSNVSRSKLFSPMRSVYFNHVVYFYIFTATSNLFLPILNIFMHIPNYFHVYLYLYLTYLDIFSCIFIPIFMYISTYFYIFLLISTYLLLFSTCRALQLLLPAFKPVILITWSMLSNQRAIKVS